METIRNKACNRPQTNKDLSVSATTSSACAFTEVLTIARSHHRREAVATGEQTLTDGNLLRDITSSTYSEDSDIYLWVRKLA